MATNPKADPEAAAATEPLSAEVQALRQDLTELGALVARIGKQRAAGLKSAATSTAAEGVAKGEAAMDVVLAELQSLEDELAEVTRRRPFASLGLAALFGFLLGVLFRR
jgi:ElaB/YqjD/DUF883 family membrane-anchored ribosome-binding protein